VKTVENRELGQRRSHPWTTATADASHRYWDFRAQPELIATELEDFRPWVANAAVGAFYQLLGWLNGPGSALESNDCAFEGPQPNDNLSYPQRLQCCGRLGVLFRDLVLNTRDREVRRWIKKLHLALHSLDKDFALGVIGTSRLRVDYLQLPDDSREGTQVLLWFWAWGDDEPEVFVNLGRVIAALRSALQSVSAVAVDPRYSDPHVE
jgi:hypothetical protein